MILHHRRGKLLAKGIGPLAREDARHVHAAEIAVAHHTDEGPALDHGKVPNVEIAHQVPRLRDRLPREPRWWGSRVIRSPAVMVFLQASR
jgi:hypothetical protein